MSIQSSLITVMVKSAYRASRKLLRDFGEVEHLQVANKVYHNFARSADEYADGVVRSELLKARPSFGLLSEEHEEISGDGEHRWIVDPIDGTFNYMHGYPDWTISIALERAGEIVAGVIYSPINDEVFWAEKGVGAYMNNRRLKVSGRRNASDAMCLCKDITDVRLQRFQFGGIRKIGCSTLSFAYVASGRADVFFISDPINIWDAAAGILLVREAKGVILNAAGKPTSSYDDIASAANMALEHYNI